MKAYVMIDIRAGEIQNVINLLRTIDSVIEANMTFGRYDAIAIVEAENINQIGKVVANKIQPIPGVIDTFTSLAVEL